MAQTLRPRRPTRKTETQVGNYRFVRLIGEGGMGQVYEVKHVELGRRAALKMLRPDVARNEETAARFFREARAMSLVQHPALVHVYEYGHLDDGGAYIVMEYVEGESLRELLRKHGGKLPTTSALTVARQMAAALHAAHDKGVIHRDLKPENIMLRTTDEMSVDDCIKILDFGIAKTLDAGADVDSMHTRPGQVVGTPTYLAPEQANAPDKIGGHTDVYALGVLLFEVLSGQPPFAGDTGLELVRKHLFSAPPRLREVVPDADPDLDALLDHMLAKAPEARPSMQEVKTRLKQIGKRIDAPESVVATPPARSLRKMLLLPALGILLMGILVGVWLRRSGTPRQPPKVAAIVSSTNVSEPITAGPATEILPSSTAVETQPADVAEVNSEKTSEEKIELPQRVAAQRPNEVSHPQVGPVLKAAPMSPASVVSVLQQAQKAIDKGDYRSALRLADSVQKLSPSRAWRLIGIAACRSRNIARSNEAYSRVDVPGQELLFNECQQSGVDRAASGFRLGKMPPKK